MTEPNIQPWFGLDDFGGYSYDDPDPKPKYNEKKPDDQEKAYDNPEQSIDKDPDKPWVQQNERPISYQDDAGVNDVRDYENGDPAADNWAEPEKRSDVPDAR